MSTSTLIKKILLASILLIPIFVLTSSFKSTWAAPCGGGNPQSLEGCTVPEEVVTAMCGSNKTFWEKIQEVVTLDIRRTVTNQVMGTIESAVMIPIIGANHETVMQCIVPWSTATGTNFIAGPGECDPAEEVLGYCNAVLRQNCDPSEDPIPPECICDPAVEDCGWSAGDSGSWGSQLARGNLLSLSNMMQNTTEAPPPVNLAFYTNKQIAKIPLLGTTYAQAPGDFGGPFLEVTYDLWQITRNAAFGLIAVVMIVVGIMIMTRKKINPQTMVTVQYAIPRILIALVLIAFSYVIGATIGSTAWVLRRSARDIVQSLVTGTDVGELIKLGVIPLLIIEMGLFIAAIVATGGATLIAFVAMLVVAAIMAILVEIKIFILYVKIIINIITAPISFALGAVPGQEKQTVNWFKSITSKALSIFLMRAIMGMAEYAIVILVVSNIKHIAGATSPGDFLLSSAEYVGMSFLIPILTPFIFIFGYYQAFKLPSKIDDAIMGAKRR